ncbi:MAG: hypothetical protein ABR562_00540 [Thermoplasmatota archaeon]|nr:hypothetical protein [Halobacteriales archaeon]
MELESLACPLCAAAAGATSLGLVGRLMEGHVRTRHGAAADLALKVLDRLPVHKNA